MTPQQQTTQHSEEPQPVTTNHVMTSDVVELLDTQTTIDPNARGDAYIPVQETNLPKISLAALEPGVLIYNPRETEAVLEVLEQYQDDFGKEKARLKLHTSDHRNGRTHSMFVPHVLRDFTYILPDGDTDTDVELSVDALTSAWDGDTASEEDSGVQTTLAEQEDTTEDKSVLLDEHSDTESNTSETTQQTLF